MITEPQKTRKPVKPQVSRMPEKYENFLKEVCGAEWRTSSLTDIDGAIGVAICKAILDGSSNDLMELSNKLGVDDRILWTAYDRLARNGYLNKTKLFEDKALIKGDVFAWCYIAGAASGATGICS